MRRSALVLRLLLSLSVLNSCATASVQGQTALRQGRYDEAASHFQEVLARDPDRLDALVGLGVSRYKLGAFDEAVEALRPVAPRAPQQQEAQLYLGLSYLQKGEDGPAEEHLTALLDLKPERRLAAQIERTLRILRGEPLSDEMRGFLTASLEDATEWEREVQEARREAALARSYWTRRPRDSCIFLRHRGFVCW